MLNVLVSAIATSVILSPASQDYTEASEQLQLAIDQSLDSDRTVAIASLSEALERHAQFPTQAKLTISDDVLEARVIQIRLMLAEGMNESAMAAMDDLIRTARDQVPPVADFGPNITKLYETRKQRLEDRGTATLNLDCEAQCSIVINERLSAQSARLLLGTYRVWTQSKPGEDWDYKEIELTEAGQTWTETIAAPTTLEPEPRPLPPSQDQTKRDKSGPLLPRGVEIGGLALGAGLAIAGAVLLGLDGRCSGSGQKLEPGVTMEECGETVFETTGSGAALLGVGAGLALVSGVTFGIDEVRRGQRRGLAVSVGMKLRF